MEEQKKILVLCGGKFAFPSLQILAYEKFLCGIAVGKAPREITQALENESTNMGIAFRSFPDKASVAGMRAWIDELQPDYIFSISFPFLLPKEVLSYGEEKFINFHPGPLPLYRGPMPIFEVLRYREPETAVTVHYMNAGFDEGDILFSDPLKIQDDDTYGSLAVRLSESTAQVAQNTANMLQFGSKIPRQPQGTAFRYFEKPEPEDTFINWDRMTADEILTLVRACNPWNEGADAVILGENVKIVSAELSATAHQSKPGTVTGYSEDRGLTLACLENRAINIHIIRSGHGILRAADYIRLKKAVLDRLPVENEISLPEIHS